MLPFHHLKDATDTIWLKLTTGLGDMMHEGVDENGRQSLAIL